MRETILDILTIAAIIAFAYLVLRVL